MWDALPCKPGKADEEYEQWVQFLLLGFLHMWFPEEVPLPALPPMTHDYGSDKGLVGLLEHELRRPQ